MPESHPRLRRMHVRIDVGRRHVDGHHHERKAVTREQRPVGGERGLQQRGIAYRPPIDDDDDVVAAAAREIGRAGNAVNVEPVLRTVHAQQSLRDRPAPHRRRPLAKVLGRRRRQRGAAVVGDAELHRGLRERQLRDRAQRGAELGRRRLEEFQPRRRVEKQVAHLDAGAALGRHGEPLGDHAPLAHQPQPLGRVARAAADREA